MRVAGPGGERTGTHGGSELEQVVGRLVVDDVDQRERGRLLGRLTGLLAGSARSAGPRAVLGGGWLSDIVAEVAPRVPVRDLGTLRTHHGGLTGDALAHALIRTASRTTALVGAAGGALASLELAAPPALLAAPVQLAAETLAVVAVEVKLVAELHVVYGQAPDVSQAQLASGYLVSWVNKRSVWNGGQLPSATAPLRAVVRAQLRGRLVRRAGRNLGTLAPLLVGAVAGAELNRRETRSLGEVLVDDLKRLARR